jgi:hypothetical protein
MEEFETDGFVRGLNVSASEDHNRQIRGLLAI